MYKSVIIDNRNLPALGNNLQLQSSMSFIHTVGNIISIGAVVQAKPDYFFLPDRWYMCSLKISGLVKINTAKQRKPC